MLFHSTRGKDSNKTFEEVLMQGLAQDGGLFIPDYWPEVNKELLRNETVNLVIQINGKKRDILSVKKDINENELLKMLNSNEKIKNFILNKKIMKKIFVPNKIINLIVE